MGIGTSLRQLVFACASVENSPPQIDANAADQISGVRPRELLLNPVRRMPSWDDVKRQFGIVGSTSFPDSCACGSYFRYLPQKIGSLHQCAIDSRINYIVDRIGSWHLVQRLDLYYRGGEGSHSRRQVPPRNLFASDYGLQIKFRLRRGAPRLQHVRQSRQAMRQAFFRSLLNGFGIRETCARSILLSQGIQQTIVGLLNLIDHPPMRVIKGKVCSQCLCFSRLDPTGSRTEVEHGVVEFQLYLEILDCLPHEPGPGEILRAVGLGECRSRQRRIQLTARDA